MVSSSWCAAFKRWRYQRWVNRLPKKRLARLRCYWWRIHSIQWQTVSVRYYAKHRIVTRTHQLDELLITTEKVYRLMEQHRIEIDQFNSKYQSKQERLLDDFLLTAGQTPSFHDAVKKCKAVLDPLVCTIEGIEFEDRELYQLYEQMSAYLIDDWLEVIDVLYALHMEISHERRKQSSAHIRRDSFAG